MAEPKLPSLYGCHDLDNQNDERIASTRSTWCLLATNIQCRQLIKNTPGKPDHYLLRDTMILRDLERFIIRQWPFNKQQLLKVINKQLTPSSYFDWLLNNPSNHFFVLLKKLRAELQSPACEVTHIRAGVWQALVRINANKARHEAQQDVERLNAIVAKLQQSATDTQPNRRCSPCVHLYHALFKQRGPHNQQQSKANYHQELAERANKTLTAIASQCHSKHLKAS